MKYKILQIKDLENSEYLFMPWRLAKEKFNLNDYETIYEGNIEPENLEEKPNEINYLEHLFYVFNVEIPEDYKGRSLSVSDVVELDDKLYYCDSAGWQLIEKQ